VSHGLLALPFSVLEPDVQHRVVGLPDLVRAGRFRPVHQVVGLLIDSVYSVGARNSLASTAVAPIQNYSRTLSGETPRVRGKAIFERDVRVPGYHGTGTP
jgi:hypothetical protein